MDGATLHEAMDMLMPDLGSTIQGAEEARLDPKSPVDLKNLMRLATEPLFADVRAALASGKRPDQDFYNDDAVINRIVNFEENLGKAFDSNMADAVEQDINNAAAMGGGDAATAFEWLKDAKLFVSVMNRFPGAHTSRFLALRDKLAETADPLVSRVLAGPVHEANMGRIRFTNEYVDASKDHEIEFPDTIDLNKPVYAHVFAETPIKKLVEMTGSANLEINGQAIQFQVSKKKLGDSAYMILDILPDDGHAVHADLINNAASVISGLDGDGACELDIAFEADFVQHYSDKAAFDLSSLDAGKVKKRAEKAAKLAEERNKAAVELPEEFTKAYSGFKDLDPARLKKLIKATWGKEVEIIAIRPRKYYKTQPDWNFEYTPEKKPFARLTNGFWSMVYKEGEKLYLYREGIQFREFYDPKSGEYGPKLFILYTSTIQPEEVTEAHLKKIKE